MDVSKGITQLRKEKNLTQAEMASALGMERSNYARLEKRGNKIAVDQLTSIAETLKVSVIEILLKSSDEKENLLIGIQDQGQTQSLEKEISDLKNENQSLKAWLRDKETIIEYYKNQTSEYVRNNAFSKFETYEEAIKWLDKDQEFNRQLIEGNLKKEDFLGGLKALFNLKSMITALAKQGAIGDFTNSSKDPVE